MGMKLALAAAILATGIGQAGAATVEERPGWFTLTSFELFCYGGCDGYLNVDTKNFLGIREGQSALAHFTISTSDDGETVDLSMRYGSSFSSVAFSGSLAKQENGTYLYDTIDHVICCSRERLSWNGKSGTWLYAPDGGTVEPYATVSFQIAAVPLPASAALLPIGIGALAMLRRRKRT